MSIMLSSGRSLKLNGELSYQRVGGKHDSGFELHSQVSHYESHDISGVTLLTDVDTTFGYGSVFTGAEKIALLHGSMALRSPVTGNKTIVVTTPVNFENDDSESRGFPVGTMLIEAQDGSRIELRANNGEPSTVEIALSIEGSTVRFTEPWDAWHDRLTVN